MEKIKRFEKSSKTYILKNKDIDVLKFDYIKKIDKTAVGEYPSYEIKHIKILNDDLLPKGYPKTVDSSRLKEWLTRRRIPRNRKNMEEVLTHAFKEFQFDKTNFLNYVDISFGLSLNDSYWVVPEDGNEYKWKDYNLYQNKFSEILSLVAFGEKGLSQQEGIRTSPEYTTDGMLAKCWTVINNEICLLKKSSEHYETEAYTEYYMAQIAEVMGFDHINYDIIKFHDNIVSSCKLFTNEKIGFVPMSYCLEKSDTFKEGGRLLEAVTKIMGKTAVEDIMVLDSLIYNTDRHLGNYGMLINNDTGQYISAAPIFDNGNSILSLIKNKPVDEVFKQYTSRIGVDFDTLSNNFVQERHKKGLEKLKEFKFIRHPKFNLPEDLLEKAEIFISQRARFIEKQLDKKLEKNLERAETEEKIIKKNPWGKPKNKNKEYENER